ncbi:hypothetical protein LguiA_005293 [Lonicera macranthoides]
MAKSPSKFNSSSFGSKVKQVISPSLDASVLVFSLNMYIGGNNIYSNMYIAQNKVRYETGKKKIWGSKTQTTMWVPLVDYHWDWEEQKAFAYEGKSLNGSN